MKQEPFLADAANGHRMLIHDGGWWSQLQLWAVLRLQYGFRRHGASVIGSGEAIAKDFVFRGLRLRAGFDAMTGATLLSESVGGDVFLLSLVNRLKGNAQPFRLRATDLFAISARGAVLTGVLEDAPIRAGDKVMIKSPRGETQGIVQGVEVDRKIIASALPGESVGILVKPFDLAAVADGSPEGGPVSLIVTQASRR